jgi:hypothetical protein
MGKQKAWVKVLIWVIVITMVLSLAIAIIPALG